LKDGFSVEFRKVGEMRRYTNSELCLMDTINIDNIETWISGV